MTYDPSPGKWKKYRGSKTILVSTILCVVRGYSSRVSWETVVPVNSLQQVSFDWTNYKNCLYL